MQRSDGMWDLAYPTNRTARGEKDRALRPWISLAVCRVLTFAGPADGIALDPRERFAVMAANTGIGGELAVVDLEPGPGFFTVRTIFTAWLAPVALSADGAVAIGPDIGSGGFAAIDLAAQAWLWGTTSAAANMLCVVR